MSTENVTEKFNSFIEETVGLPLETIRQQEAEETDKFIEESKNVKLKMGYSGFGISFRGNPLLSMGKVISHDVDKEFVEKFSISI